jgi:hypothetical protein
VAGDDAERRDFFLELRRYLHEIGTDLAGFITKARRVRVDPDEVELFNSGNGRHSGHPNVVAYLHNIDVAEALSNLDCVLDWAPEPGLPSTLMGFREEVLGLAARWGWVLGSEKLPCTIDEPARVLTSDEADRFFRFLADIEMMAASLADDGGPPYFRSMAYLDSDGVAQIGEELERLRADPEAEAAFHDHTFVRAYRLGWEGRNPEPDRLGDILEKADEFLRRVALGLVIEGDPDCPARLFAFPRGDGEFYAMQAASALFEAMQGEGGQLGESSVSHAYGWPVEVNLGLRTLDNQLHELLDRWDVLEWQERLKLRKPEPDPPATIRRDELEGMRRVIAIIREGLSRLSPAATDPPDRPAAGVDGAAAEAAEDRPGPLAPRTTKGETAAHNRIRVIELYHDHPGMSYAQIAEIVGYTPGHVCRILKPLRDRDHEQRRRQMPRGRMDREKGIEAWEGE